MKAGMRLDLVSVNRREAGCLLPWPMVTSAPSSGFCVFSLADCLCCHQISLSIPLNKCSHSVFEHKHTPPVPSRLQLVVCVGPLHACLDAISVISVRAANLLQTVFTLTFYFFCQIMAGFPWKQGNGPISPFSYSTVLTKHSTYTCVPHNLGCFLFSYI